MNQPARSIGAHSTRFSRAVNGRSLKRKERALTGDEWRVGGHAADADGHLETVRERRWLAHHKRALHLRHQRRDHCVH